MGMHPLSSATSSLATEVELEETRSQSSPSSPLVKVRPLPDLNEYALRAAFSAAANASTWVPPLRMILLASSSAIVLTLVASSSVNAGVLFPPYSSGGVATVLAPTLFFEKKRVMAERPLPRAGGM
jgi:hypothetical protein